MKLFNRGPKQPSEMHSVIAAGIISAEAQHRDQTDTEIMKELGINTHMIEDDRFSNALYNLAIRPMKNEKGADVNYVLPPYLVIWMLRTKLVRTSIITPADAEIGILESRCLLRRVKMKMSEEEYENGGALIADAAGVIIETHWLSAVNGKMAQLLKITPREHRIVMQEGVAKKETYG